MMVNLMMMDMDNRKIPHDEQFLYIQTNLAYIMAALSTVFCLFDGNAGANFTCLNSLESTTHPIPAIRLVYAEEIADGCLEHYIPENEKRFEAESEWQKMVCDVEADYKGTVDMGQVFFFPAYTEKAQRHISRIKRRMTDMYDSMSPFVVCNRAPKMGEEELAFLPEAVRFDETGKSLWLTTKTKGKYIISRMFPNMEWCKCYAPVVYKFPVLLPFYWVWRLIYKGITKRKKVTQEIKAIKAGK